MQKVRNRDGQKIYAGCLFSDRFSDTDKKSDINNPEWAANTEYIHYGWTLARSDGGKWRIISEGY